MTRLDTHGVLLTVFAVLGTLVSSACAQSRNISIAVNVKAGTGSAVAHIPVGVVGGSVAVARTNEAGQAVLSTEVPTTRVKVLIMLAPWCRSGDYPEREEDIARYKVVTSASAFEPFYELALDPQLSTYSIEVVGRPTVQVTGRIISSEEVLKRRSIQSRWSTLLARPSPTTGDFQVAVPQGEATDLFLWTSDGGEIQPISVTAQQTAASCSVGDVAVAAVASGRKVEIQVSGFHGLRMTPELPKEGVDVVCLISANGGRIFAAGITRSGRVCLRDRELSPLQVPPGTYYVATGGMSYSGYGVDLWKLLKAGREADVQAAQVPKLVVPNDGATSVIQWSFDASQAATAIRSIQ